MSALLDNPDSLLLARKGGKVPLVHLALRSYQGALRMSFSLASVGLKSERWSLTSHKPPNVENCHYAIARSRVSHTEHPLKMAL